MAGIIVTVMVLVINVTCYIWSVVLEWLNEPFRQEFCGYIKPELHCFRLLIHMAQCLSSAGKAPSQFN